MSVDWGTVAIGVGILAVLWIVVLPLVSAISGAENALGNFGADVSSAFSSAGADIGNPIAAAQGNGTGFFGAVFALGESLNPATQATETKWAQEEAYNDNVTSQENTATAAVTTATSSGNAQAIAQADYNELMVEVNNYDGAVAPLMTFASFQACEAAGLTSNQINSCMNELQALYSSYGSNAPSYVKANTSTVQAAMVSAGFPSAMASSFLANLGK